MENLGRKYAEMEKDIWRSKSKGLTLDKDENTTERRSERKG